MIRTINDECETRLDNVDLSVDNVQNTNVVNLKHLQVILGYVAHDRQRCKKLCRNQEFSILNEHEAKKDIPIDRCAKDSYTVSTFPDVP